MASFVLDNVKAEKAYAMRKFNRRRRRNFQKLFPMLETVTAILVLLSWFFSTSTAQIGAVDIAVDYVRQLAGCFNNGLFIFTIVNALILVIFSLSHLKKPTEPDLYDQYVSFTSTAASKSTSKAAIADKSPALEKSVTYEDKQIVPVPVTNKVSVSRPRKKTVYPVADSVVPTKQKTVDAGSSETETVPPAGRGTDVILPRGEALRSLNSVIEDVPLRREMLRAVSSVTEAARDWETGMIISPRDETRNYRRSRSERIDRREIQRWSAIDNLSSEEFRMTVETFIAAKRKTLMQETTVEREADVGTGLGN